MPAALWGGVERRQGKAAASQTTSPAEYLLPALEAIEPEPPPAGTKEFAVLRETERQERPIEQAKEASTERKHMARKGFGVAQKDESQANGNWTAPGTPANSGESVHTPVASNVSERKMNVREAEDAASSIELLSMTDIYQSAGILSPRKGYSILKVVEMLRSEHLRGLAKEMKRATVLVALDAAELERIKATYAERMRRNLEGVAREKATFGNWLAGSSRNRRASARRWS
jgi:hypothetical protein